MSVTYIVDVILQYYYTYHIVLLLPQYTAAWRGLLLTSAAASLWGSECCRLLTPLRRWCCDPSL